MNRSHMKKGFRLGSKGGFTLIELLLVMVILTVLASVVALNTTNKSKESRITAAKVDISNLDIALDAFEIQMGRYPTSSEGLDALVKQPTGTNASSWKGPYLKKQEIPNDPWGNKYVYTIPGKHNTYGYDLYSYGPDGQDGGSDDIDNWSTN